MKVMMVHPHDIYHDLEPWTVRITYLAQELVRMGHEVQLVYFLFDPHKDTSASVLHQGYEFHTVPLHRDPLSIIHNFKVMQRIAHWADIVHFQKCSNYAAVPAVAAAYFQGRPLHYDWDDWEQAIFEKDDTNPIGSWIYFQQMEKHLLKVVDTVSVASGGLEQLCKKMKFPSERTSFIPVGADMDVFSPQVDGSAIRKKHTLTRNLVLYQGQLSGSNYVHLYLQAARHLLDTRQDVDFLVVGGGDRLKNAVSLAEKLGISEHVFFTNKVPHHMVPKYIAAADVVVATFESNSQVLCKSPLKVIEYMASGKAVVASNVGEVPNMVGNCGLLVAPDSSEEVAEKINILLDDKDLRKKLGKKARQRAERMYSWKNSAQTLVKSYYHALKYHHGIE